MSLPIPRLDDKTFDGLVSEAQALIPVFNREWTDYNPSDPGITLIELFAWLAEMTIYRTDQVTEQTYRNFLGMVGISTGPDESIESAIQRAHKSLTEQYRAITTHDFERLTMDCLKGIRPDLAGRAICMSNRDLEYSTSDKEKPGHVSIIVIPLCNEPTEYCTPDGLPTDLLRSQVKTYLQGRRLITTRIHVAAPTYKTILLRIRLVLKNNSAEAEVIRQAAAEIEKYYDPVIGGPGGTGWPLGRNVYRSELYYLLEGISGVDHVASALIDGDADVKYVEVREHELVRILQPQIEVERETDEY